MPGGYVRDIVERVTPSIMLGRHDGLTRVDEFEARHVKETAVQLRVPLRAGRRSGIAAGTLAIVGPDLPPGRRPGGFAGSPRRHRRRLTRDTPSHLGRSGMTSAYRVVCAGSGTAGPATDADLLAAQGIGDWRSGTRDRRHRGHRGRGRQDHRRLETPERSTAAGPPPPLHRHRCPVRIPRSRRR